MNYKALITLLFICLVCIWFIYSALNKCKELHNENKKFKEMVEDMKADMCGTENIELCEYLMGILKKYGEIV